MVIILSLRLNGEGALMAAIRPHGDGYVRFKNRASREKFYAACFAFGVHGRYARRWHKTATDAIEYCDAVIARYERVWA